MVNEAASFLAVRLIPEGRSFGVGIVIHGQGEWEDGGLGTGIFNKIIGQKNEKLTGLVNQPASFCSMELIPQECTLQVWGLDFMEGEGGRRWQVRGISFLI